MKLKTMPCAAQPPIENIANVCRNSIFLKPNTMMHAVKLIYKCNIQGPFNVQKK